MILVIDDHADSRYVMMRLLKRIGYDAVELPGGREAIDYLRQESGSSSTATTTTTAAATTTVTTAATTGATIRTEATTTGATIRTEATTTGGAATAAPTATTKLIILDCNMPGISGLDVLRFVRGDSRLAALPVVIFTADEATARTRGAFEALGIQGWIAKASMELSDLEEFARRYAGDAPAPTAAVASTAPQADTSTGSSA